MALSDLTSRDAVLKAIAERKGMDRQDFLSKYGFGESRDYVVVHEGESFDSKALVGAAHGYQHPELGPLGSGDFSGGKPTIDTLRALGFEVQRLDHATREHAVWNVRGGEHGDSEPDSLRDGYVAIGWADLPGLSETKSKEDVASLMRRVYPDRSSRKIGSQKVSIHDFVRSIVLGDIVLLPLKTQPGRVAVGRVTGDYEYRPDAEWHSRHVRRVEWLETDVEIERFDYLKRWINLPPTVTRIPVAAEVITGMLASGKRVAPPPDRSGELPVLLETVLQEMQLEDPSVDRLRELVTEEGPAAVQAAAGEGWTVKGRIGIGRIAEVPWISVYPPGAAASAQSGFYAVYLFAADGSAVYLSLNQSTELVQGGTRPIEKRAIDLRAAARIDDKGGREIDLRSNASRPKKYEAGNAFAIRYAAEEIPSTDVLKADLARVLEYLRTATASGFAFGSVEPVHLVLKWSADIEAQTVALHQAKARETGSVWWGRFGQGASPMSASRLEQLQAQLKAGLPTYAFLYGGSQTTRTTIQEITADPSTVDDERLPGYYDRAACNLFVRLSDFDDLESAWLTQHVVLASTPELSRTQGALGNQTNPLYVYELFVPDEEPPPAHATELTIDWLIAQTLWKEEDLEELIHALDTRGQVILAGPPGTGKTWVAKHVARYLTQDQPLQLRTIQFHPSYGYEEFVEGLRPVIEDEVLTFKRVDGVVKQLAAAMEDSATTHVLIIDELNRANIPRVFGELMYLLEYRGEEIDLQYSRDFELPENLKLIATMNTADRSIRSIDVALRRRFEIFECGADADILAAYYGKGGRSTSVPGLVAGFVALNEALAERLDRHHTVGQSFFMKDGYSEADLRRIWRRQIAPLVEDYFFDQPDVVDAFNPEIFWSDL